MPQVVAGWFLTGGNLWKLWSLDILWDCFPVVALFQIQPSSVIQFGESPLESDRFYEETSRFPGPG